MDTNIGGLQVCTGGVCPKLAPVEKKCQVEEIKGAADTAVQEYVCIGSSSILKSLRGLQGSDHWLGSECECASNWLCVWVMSDTSYVLTKWIFKEEKVAKSSELE